jgi:hypothetical protein
LEAEAEAEAYCRQPTGALTPGIRRRSDPWPYICSMSRPLLLNYLESSQSHIATDGQSISKSWCRAPSGLMTRYLLLFGNYGLVFVGRPPLGLVNIFYCLRFETSLFVASYDSQGHGKGIRPRLHAGIVP